MVTKMERERVSKNLSQIQSSHQIQLVYKEIMNGHLPRSSPLKSSHQAPSCRIDQLFSQFQSLKTRIRSNSANRPHQASASVQKEAELTVRKDLFQPPLDLCLERKGRSQLSKRNQNRPMEGNMFSSSFICNGEGLVDQFKKQKQEPEKEAPIMQEAFEIDGLSNLESVFNKKIDSFEGKLGVCQEMVRGIATLLKMKKSARVVQKTRRGSFLSLSHEKERPVAHIIQDYEERIQKLTTRFEAKIKSLEKENSKNSETCESRSRDSFVKEANQFESLLLARDSEISLLKIENSKLRRANDKLQTNFANKLHLVAQLESQVLKATSHKTVQQFQQKITGLKTKIKSLQQQLQGKRTKDQRCLVRNKESLPDNLCQNSFLAETIVVQMQEGLSITHFEECRSQVMEPRRKKRHQVLKQLEVEIDLMTEQNRNLESKKHFLEHQNKSIEQDEDRFQTQSNILKQQIRFLTANLDVLDEAAVNLLKGKEMSKDRLNKLDDHLKSKSVLLEKCSKKK